MNFIAAFTAAEGHAPTLEEIRAHLRVAAVSTVHHHVARLVEKGYLERSWNRGRSLVPGPSAAPASAVRLVPVTGIVSRGGRVVPRPAGGEVAVAGELARSGATYALRVRTYELRDESIRRGDTLLVGPRRRDRPGSLLVISLGAGYVLARMGRGKRRRPAPLAAGEDEWRTLTARVDGVVVGLVRSDP